MQADLYPWLIPSYQQLIFAFQQAHGHHALLFKSEQGIGVQQLIRKVAHWLICQHSKDNQPCGQCHSCHLFQAGTHPDVYNIQPIDGKDIGVDQIREMNEKVNQFAQQNGNKVIFIQGAEYLTSSAANALLKTLEEPRNNTYFLLQADLSSPVMPTIHSRCQTWLITPPKWEQALVWLQQHSKQEFSQIQTALRISYTRPLLALEILNQHLLAKRQLLFQQFWRFYQREDVLQLIPYFEKEIVLHQLDWLLAFLSDSLKLKLGIQTNLICLDYLKAIEKFAQINHIQTILRANHIMQKVRLDLVQINAVNQELILIDGLTKIIFAKKEV